MNVTDKYIFFWNGIYSQWFASDFVDEKNIKYSCAEQYMMAHKARLFRDLDVYNEIMKTESPAEQKAWGRKIRNFDVNKWEEVAVNIVTLGNYFKFTQNRGLYTILMETDDKIIVEASPYDKIWGIGMREDDEGIEDESNWDGRNWLGISIMNVRNMLRSNNI